MIIRQSVHGQLFIGRHWGRLAGRVYQVLLFSGHADLLCILRLAKLPVDSFVYNTWDQGDIMHPTLNTMHEKGCFSAITTYFTVSMGEGRENPLRARQKEVDTEGEEEETVTEGEVQGHICEVKLRLEQASTKDWFVRRGN